MRQTAHPAYGHPYERFPEKDIINWLKANPKGGTAHTIAKALNYKTHNWVAAWLFQLHQHGKVYHADFERHAVQGPPRTVFALRLGDEVDMPPPKAQTPTEKTDRYRKKKRALRLIQRAAGDCHA